MKFDINMTLERIKKEEKEYFNITNTKLTWDADE